MILLKRYFLAVLISIGLISAFLQSCSYENKEELFPATDCDVSMVTYSGHIVPLLDENCNGCHSTSEASGGYILDTYQDVLPVAEDGLLFCVVNHDDNCSEMPKNLPKLQECDILTLKTWIDDGALEN